MNVCRVVLLVKDLEASVSFYRDTLGLSVRTKGSEWAEFSSGEARLCLRGPWDGMVYRIEDFGRSPDELLFLVDDLDETVRALTAKGVAVRRPHTPGPGLRVAELADPDGRRVALEERN